MGGGLRIPRVSDLIKEATEKSELMVHLNGDEAMSFGSSFIAANSSSQYKVRKVYLTQRPQFDIQVKIRPLVEREEADLENSEITYSKDFTLFKTSDYLGMKKTINLSYDVDMMVQAFAVYPDGSEQHLIDVELKEIEKIANNDAAKKEGSTTPKVSLSFELNRSQILKVTKAEVKFDEFVRTEIKPEVKKVEDKKEEAEAGSNEASEGEQTEASAEEVESVAAPEEPTFKEEMVPRTFPLLPAENLPSSFRLLTKSQKDEARKRIKALEKRDNDKLKTDEAKNDFESLIYAFKDFLADEANLKYTNEAESLHEKLEKAQDWLDDAGSDVGFKEYQTKGYDLQSDFSKLKTRKQEHNFREENVPVVFDRLRQMRDETGGLMEKKPWLNEEEVKDLAEKIEDCYSWLDGKMQEQEEAGLASEPAFTVDQLTQRLERVLKLHKKINNKKKPKEKKPKEE